MAPRARAHPAREPRGVRSADLAIPGAPATRRGSGAHAAPWLVSGPRRRLGRSRTLSGVQSGRPRGARGPAGHAPRAARPRAHDHHAHGSAGVFLRRMGLLAVRNDRTLSKTSPQDAWLALGPSGGRAWDFREPSRAPPAFAGQLPARAPREHRWSPRRRGRDRPRGARAGRGGRSVARAGRRAGVRGGRGARWARRLADVVSGTSPLASGQTRVNASDYLLTVMP